MKVEIKHRYTGAVLFEYDVPEKYGVMAMRYAIEKATELKANINYANLTDADLTDADLTDANLKSKAINFMAELREGRKWPVNRTISLIDSMVCRMI